MLCPSIIGQFVANCGLMHCSARALADKGREGRLIPLGLLAFKIIMRAPSARAVSSRTTFSVAVWGILAGLTSTAIVVGERNAALLSGLHSVDGMLQNFSRRSISLQRAPITSPVRAAVKMRNSKARAEMPSCFAKPVLKVPHG